MAVQASPWDDPSVKPKGARFAKFNNVGDTYEGVITEIKVTVFDQGKDSEKSCPVLVLDTGQEVTCSASNLHRDVYELRPEVDDRISIRYIGDDENDYNRKLFDINLVRATDPAPVMGPRDEDVPLPEEETSFNSKTEDPWASSVSDRHPA